MIHLKALLVTIVFAATGCASAPPPEPPFIPSDRGETTVYIVRHAEKAAENPSDPELSAIGYVRADSLASTLRDAGVNAIIVTSLKRTALTALPLARRRGITPQVVPVGGSTAAHIDSVVATIHRNTGATILVVGHSNTVGHIAGKLGGRSLGDLCDSEYSNLIIISMPRAKQAKMLVERYGPADPPSHGSCVPMRKL